jgi:hypothetical protein
VPENGTGESFTVSGIVNDIMQESPFYPVVPLYITLASMRTCYNLILRLNPTQKCKQSLVVLKKFGKSIHRQVPFDIIFIDEEFGKIIQGRRTNWKTGFLFGRV